MTETRFSPFAETPKPPYYVVTFSSLRTAGDNGYGAMADRMADLALQQPGCLGAESARDADGFGITNSFWTDEESLKAWKQVASHLAAQHLGRERWYSQYKVRIARVERDYDFTAEEGDSHGE